MRGERTPLSDEWHLRPPPPPAHARQRTMFPPRGSMNVRAGWVEGPHGVPGGHESSTPAEAHHDAPDILLTADVAIVLMAIATALLGVQVPGPFYDIVPDPAGLSGLPF